MTGVRLAMAIVGALLSAAASGTVYRWVDAQGQTHYGDSPPAGVQVQSIPLQLLPPGSGEAQRAIRDYVRTIEAREAERAKEAMQKRQQKKHEAARKAACKSSRALRTRLEKPHLLEYQADGSARRLTEEERQARIQETEAYIVDVCSNAP